MVNSMLNIKKLQFKQYNKGLLTNVISSQFVYKNPNVLPVLNKVFTTIKAKHFKKIHFWYLSLLTNQKPYIKEIGIQKSKHIEKTLVLKSKARAVSSNV
jgi:hypothetical protein